MPFHFRMEEVNHWTCMSLKRCPTFLSRYEMRGHRGGYCHVCKIFGGWGPSPLWCCLARALLIESEEAAASYRLQPAGVLVRRLCDVKAELHLLTRPSQLKLRAQPQGGHAARFGARGGAQTWKNSFLRMNFPAPRSGHQMDFDHRNVTVLSHDLVWNWVLLSVEHIKTFSLK